MAAISLKLFKKLFNTPEKQEEFLDRRRADRYTLGTGFPLQAIDPISKFNYEIATISTLGMGLKAGKNSPSNELKKIKLQLEDFEVNLPLNVKNSKEFDTNTVLGIELEFENMNQKMDYHQILLPVIIGSTLKEMSPEMVNQNESGFHKRIFKSSDSAYLTLRYIKDGDASIPKNFEFEFECFDLRGTTQDYSLEIFNIEKSQNKSSHLLNKNSNQNDRKEMFKLFFWTVQNMQKNLEPDIRKYLANFR